MKQKKRRLLMHLPVVEVEVEIEVLVVRRPPVWRVFLAWAVCDGRWKMRLQMMGMKPHLILTPAILIKCMRVRSPHPKWLTALRRPPLPCSSQHLVVIAMMTPSLPPLQLALARVISRWARMKLRRVL
jgi:hypothetical protein